MSKFKTTKKATKKYALFYLKISKSYIFLGKPIAHLTKVILRLKD